MPGYADYYPEAPGGKAAGRSIEPVPLNGKVLGPELAHLNPPYLPAPKGVTITQGDYRWLSLGPRHPRSVLAAAKVAGRLVRARVLRQHPLSMGQALAAGLRAGLLAADVPVWLGTPMTGLRTVDDRVTGIKVIRDGSLPLSRPPGVWCWPQGDLNTTARCGGSTSGSRSAPNGQLGLPATPAMRSAQGRPRVGWLT